MALAAIRQLLEWTVARVAASLQVRTDEIAAGAEQLGLMPPPRNVRAPHMLGLELPREAAGRFASTLAEAGVIASVRSSSLRIAPHLHNSDDDVGRLLDALGEAAARA